MATDMSPLPVTVIVPTKNEEKNIRECLESVRWAEKVYVVDSHSGDRTGEIAEELGAEVVQFDYDGGWPRRKTGRSGIYRLPRRGF